MRLLFVDRTPWDYTPATPAARPLGGMQSAVCYLAAALARQGLEVGLANATRREGSVEGVECFNLASPPPGFAADCDAVIAVGTTDPAAVAALRPVCRRARFFAWTGHAADQPAVAALLRAEARDAWDGVICVSDWQAADFIARFRLEPARVTVLRNAIAPAFAGLFGRDAILPAKTWPPVLAYTSTPYRGLDRLIAAFPRIRAAFPGARLEVYSSMAVYGVAGGDDRYAELYARCRQTAGVDYVGAIPQPRLARALKRVTCLVYPNTFAETSCIAVMEAMAAGCLVVTSDLGALPETTAGMAELVAVPAGAAAHVSAFAAAVVGVLARHHVDDGAEARLGAQVEHANATLTWETRAAEWRAFLARPA